jgi:NAD-dependent deacetylase
MSKKKIVILTGAGISAESGIKTFRDADGLWEGYDIMEVASPQGWKKNKELVLDFYNQRRAQLHEVEPNEGHLALARLDEFFDVSIVTQNVDNLHERSGSRNVIHLHGELFKVRSTADENLIYEWTGPLKNGDKCEKGNQLRPHIVWFGESVPMIEKAIALTEQADIFMIVGTSMQVYPAAGLIRYAPEKIPVYFIDPNPALLTSDPNFRIISDTAVNGLPPVVTEIIEKYS